MSDLSLRFLHASDFKLDQPLHGLTEIPDHMRDALIDGPYRAAERIFDTAISEDVAFVCFSGDLLDLPRATPRSLSFLLEQFRRLDARGIQVYWAHRRADAACSWPAVLPLPECVHCFHEAAITGHTHETGSGFVARILGRGGTAEISAADFAAPADGQYSVAVVRGDAEGADLAKRNIDYWALGGRIDRQTLCSEPTVAHYCGAPQGFNPQNIGPHGCTLVEVQRPRETHLRFVPCDVVRWHHERVMVSAAASWSDLQDILAQRVGEMRSQTPSIPLFVRWTLTAADGFVDTGSLRGLADRASEWLKKHYGYNAECCWPVSVTVDVHQQIPASAYEEDTLLGDYLRSVREMCDGGHLTVLESPCVPQPFPDELRWLTDLSDATTRDEVLREATTMGAALLRGEKVI